MRLKSLTNLNTLLLVTVCVALAVTLWWSQRALERPYLLMARYLSLSQQFQGDVAQNISAYLESGDALRHSAALQALGNLEHALDELPAQLASDLRPSLAALSAFMSCWPPASSPLTRKACSCKPSEKSTPPLSNWRNTLIAARPAPRPVIGARCSTPRAT